MKVAVGLLIGLAALAASAPTKEEKLATALFKEYNKNVNPGTTTVQIYFNPQCAEINKVNLHLTSRVVEKYTWVDSRLTWSPKDHGDLQSLRYPARHLWTPDFKLYSAHQEVETRDEVNALIYSNGTVLWVPIATYNTGCMPLRRNTFHCPMTFGLWSYDAGTVGLTTGEPAIGKEMYLNTCAFEIVEPKVEIKNETYPCCPDQPYSTLYLNFVLQDRT